MPARLSDLARVLALFGVAVVEPNKGSHWKAKRDGKTYPLAAHNGPKTELSDVYLRGVCRAFDIDFDELKKRL